MLSIYLSVLCKDLQHILSGKSQIRIIQPDTFKSTFKPPPQNGTERKSSALGCSQFRGKIPALKKSIYKYRNTRCYVYQLENKQARDLSFRLVWQMEVDSQDWTFWIDEHEHTHAEAQRQRGKEREREGERGTKGMIEWWRVYMCMMWCGRESAEQETWNAKGPRQKNFLL